MRGPIAFVVPRSGPGVVGGAEAVCREAATGLAARGWDVEILTTCAVDHYSWANELPPGVTEEGGVTVRRWEMVHDGTRAGLRAQRRIEEGVVPPLDEQVSWVSFRFQVPGLFHHLLRYGDRYQAVVFAPYLFWTSTVCLPAVADRAVSLPCLHDETYARLDVARPVLADPAAVWFLSEPEHDLAHRLGPLAPRHHVVGAGVEVPGAYDADGFRRRHRLTRPFVLYAGRREKDKGWPWLLETFRAAVDLGGVDVDLVTAGVGEVEVPASLAGKVIDLGFLAEGELNDAFAAAAAYVQPSRMESFSRTVMESWLAGTPVLAWDQGEVVAWHCRRSGGGRVFADAAGLADCLRWLLTSPAEAEEMAERGRNYVLSQYTWPVVLDRMEADLEDMAPAEPGGVPPPRAAVGPLLVVGTYPPSPLPAAEVTVDQVRAAYARGEDVVVASPRHGAAHRTSRMVGLAAGPRLSEVKAQTGARRLVLCAERGMPFPPLPPAGPARRLAERGQRLTAARLADACAAFERVTLVEGPDLGVDSAALATLRAAADDRVTAPATRPASRPAPAGDVTLFGPPEVLPRERPRQAISITARAVLGPYAPAVRQRVAGVVRRVRAVASGAGHGRGEAR